MRPPLSAEVSFCEPSKARTEMRSWPIIVCAIALRLSSIAGPGEPIYGSGLDVRGMCFCSDPVPYMNGSCLFRTVLEFSGLYSTSTNSMAKAYFGRDSRWHNCNSVYDERVSWTNRMQHFHFVYRYRTVDSLSDWKSVCMSDEWRITERPVDPPSLAKGESCDMEYFVQGYMSNPSFVYTDYSGLGIGLPGYRERNDLACARNFRQTPSRMNLTKAGNWVRIQPFRTRLSSLTINDGVTASEFENVPDSPSNYEDPSTAGFFIRSVSRDDKGIGVAFDTEEDPPYSVAVYKIHDIGLSRRRPLQHVVVSNNFAHITCSGYFDETVFIQVGNDLGIESDITADELYRYRRLKDMVAFDRSDEPKAVRQNRMHLVSDDKWSGFFPCQSNVFSVSVSGMLPFVDGVNPVIVDGSWFGLYDARHFPPAGQYGITFTNWTMRAGIIIQPTEFHFPSGVESFGRGYRITIDERSGFVDVTRAYSYAAGRSDEFILPRGYKTLSVDDGRYGVSIDWTGVEYWQKYTNAVPGVIYGNGVPN